MLLKALPEQLMFFLGGINLGIAIQTESPYAALLGGLFVLVGVKLWRQRRV